MRADTRKHRQGCATVTELFKRGNHSENPSACFNLNVCRTKHYVPHFPSPLVWLQGYFLALILKKAFVPRWEARLMTGRPYIGSGVS